jgi:hypothetical protein
MSLDCVQGLLSSNLCRNTGCPDFIGEFRDGPGTSHWKDRFLSTQASAIAVDRLWWLSNLQTKTGETSRM